MTLTLDFLRHGACQDDCWLRGSRTNSALSQQGWQQMQQQVQQQHILMPYDALVTSPLKRCQPFTEQLQTNYALPLLTLPELQERDFGEWDGLPFEQIQQQSPHLLEQYLNDPFHTQIPEAETVKQFQSRFQTGWEKIQSWASEHSFQHLLIITHGGIIRTAIQQTLKLPNTHWYHLKIDPASLSRFAITPTDEQPFVQFAALLPPPRSAHA